MIVLTLLGADKDGLPILPEARKLSGPVLCVYSKDDADALCPKVGMPNVRVAALPGGHHFGGAYSKLAELILAPVS